MTQQSCIHHWLIDNYNFGRCKKCGDTKDFAKLLKRYTSLLFTRLWGAK